MPCSRSIDSMQYLRLRRMRLTAGIRVRAVHAPLLVVRPPVAGHVQRLRRGRLRIGQHHLQGLLLRQHPRPQGSHLLADGSTKVAGRQWHYIFRVSELFVLLETRPTWKVSARRRRTAAPSVAFNIDSDPKNSPDNERIFRQPTHAKPFGLFCARPGVGIGGLCHRYVHRRFCHLDWRSTFCCYWQGQRIKLVSIADLAQILQTAGTGCFTQKFARKPGSKFRHMYIDGSTAL